MSEAAEPKGKVSNDNNLGIESRSFIAEGKENKISEPNQTRDTTPLKNSFSIKNQVKE